MAGAVADTFRRTHGSDMVTPGPAPSRMRLGALLMLLSLAGALLLATLSPAVAQEDEETPTVEPEKTAQYSNPESDTYTPNTATEEVPPGVVCIVFSQVCGEETQTVTGPVNEQLDQGQEQSQAAPVQPTPPEGLTMSINQGEIRYTSGVRYPQPDVPESQRIDSYVLSFDQDNDFTFHSESPAFRQAALAAVAAVGAQDPEVFQEEFQKALAEEPANTEQVMGLEACPFTQPFEATEHPQTADRSELPRNEDGTLAIDCILGANGQYDEETQTWSFDLTLAANAWASGDAPAEGLYIRPTASENVAYGDPDPSTNAQVVLQPAARAATESSEPPPPPEPLDSGGDSAAAPGTDASSGATTTTTPSGAGNQPVFGQPPSTTSSDEQPSVAEPAATAAPAEQQPAQQPAEQVQAAGEQAPTTPWWVWLLVPTFLGGAFMVTESLTAEAVVAAGGGRSGAMTRLIEKRAAGLLGGSGSTGPATA